MSTQPNGPTGPPPPHVGLTPELREKYINLLGQHMHGPDWTPDSDQPPPPTKADIRKLAASVESDEDSPEFSFDDFNILGADNEGLVYLQARYYVAKDEDPFKPCIIITTRRALKKALDYWLDDKADYGVRGEGGVAFCGAMGSVQALKYVELPEENRCELMPAHYEPDADCDDATKWEWKPVRTFYVASFAKGCNMEHG